MCWWRRRTGVRHVWPIGKRRGITSSIAHSASVLTHRFEERIFLLINRDNAFKEQ